MLRIVISLISLFQGFLALYGFLGLLLYFKVVTAYSGIFGSLWHVLQQLFEPLLSPIRHFLKPYQCVDWSFLVIFVLLIGLIQVAVMILR